MKAEEVVEVAADLSVDEKYNLITKSLEVVGEAEMKAILAKRQLRIYWGTATTGKPHFGYFVPIYKISDFLKAGCHVTILFADVHAALDNLKSDWELLKFRCQWYELVIKQMLAMTGAPQTHLKFIRGSEFQLSREYTLDVYKMSAKVSTWDTKKAGSEVVKQTAHPLMSNLLYPILQALDEEYLKVDVQFGGLDQRKIFMFARESLPKLGFAKRCHIMNPLIPGLQAKGGKMQAEIIAKKVEETAGKPSESDSAKGEDADLSDMIENKMSASIVDSKIDFDDSGKLIKSKLKRAFSKDGEVEGNGILAMIKHVLFRFLDAKGSPFLIKRPEKWGGDITFPDYATLEKAFTEGTLASGDLKPATATLLSEFLAPLRKLIAANKELRFKAYPEEAPKKTGLQFSSLEVKVGVVVSCALHEGADSMLVEQIDVGEAEPRQIVSGIRAYYSPEALVGKRVLVCTNLKTAKLRGVESAGMVLAASKKEGDKTVVALVEAPAGAKIGEVLTVKGDDAVAQKPTISSSKKKNILKALNMTGGVFSFKKDAIITSAGTCTCAIKDGDVS